MSLGAALNSALHGLRASQIALAVASNNISNAETPGYTRQRAILAAAPTSGDRFRLGGGVQVLGTEATRDLLIELRMRQESSLHAQEQMTYDGLSDIEMLFNESETAGMLNVLSGFFNSFHALSAEPASVVARQEVTSAATRLAAFLNSRAAELGAIRLKVDRAMSEDVAHANTLIDKIAALSKRIAEDEVIQPAHELRDERTVLVKQLAEIMSVQEIENGGEYQVTTAGNRPLVYNGTVTHLQTVVGAGGMTEIHLGLDDITADIAAGRLAARRDLRDNNVPAYLAELDQLAYVLTQQVNALHTTAYGLDGSTNNNFFTPIAAVAGAAQAMAVDAGILADAQKIAASRQPNGTGNEAAVELGNLINQSIFASGTVVDHYRNLAYAVGSDTANADLARRQHEGLLNQLENRRQEVSGVSIDEETLMLLRFQRAFEASARVVKAVDELLELTMTLGQ
jgi:flagellar hook-associated protein 1 FlgK